MDEIWKVSLLYLIFLNKFIGNLFSPQMLHILNQTKLCGVQIHTSGLVKLREVVHGFSPVGSAALELSKSNKSVTLKNLTCSCCLRWWQNPPVSNGGSACGLNSARICGTGFCGVDWHLPSTELLPYICLVFERINAWTVCGFSYVTACSCLYGEIQTILRTVFWEMIFEGCLLTDIWRGIRCYLPPQSLNSQGNEFF